MIRFSAAGSSGSGVGPSSSSSAVAGKAAAHTEILPLYARLSAAEQRRVFHPGTARRIILATNVAETSLTVPRIRFVIDSGLVRISRYAHRSRIQRLPIEPVSQASAQQRAGRCGRLGSGTCVRLYSEEDFDARPEFTEPEILRTSLASVILRMLTMRLGAVEEFPFVDRPAPRTAYGKSKLAGEEADRPADKKTEVKKHGTTVFKSGGLSLQALNPDVNVIAHQCRLTSENVLEIIKDGGAVNHPDPFKVLLEVVDVLQECVDEIAGGGVGDIERLDLLVVLPDVVEHRIALGKQLVAAGLEHHRAGDLQLALARDVERLGLAQRLRCRCRLGAGSSAASGKKGGTKKTKKTK